MVGHPSYKKRVKQLSTHYPQKKELSELADWALEEKLLPKAPMMKAIEVIKLYQKVHNYFFSEMYSLLTQYYGCRINNPRGIERYLKHELSHLLLTSTAFPG